MEIMQDDARLHQLLGETLMLMFETGMTKDTLALGKFASRYHQRIAPLMPKLFPVPVSNDERLIELIVQQAVAAAVIAVVEASLLPHMPVNTEPH